MKIAIARMMDANANRAREALRVLEDYARFALNDQPLAHDLKNMRHTLAQILESLGAADATLSRDTGHDVGTANKTAREFQRTALSDVVLAAGKRLSEAFRVLEECAKTLDTAAAGRIERLRYRGYELEQILLRTVGQANAQERMRQVRLYVLLTESLCHPAAGGWEKTLDALLASGVHAIQLREKHLPDGEFVRRARRFVGRCRDKGVIAIVNDRPDIALLAGADGVHVGQTDMSCVDIRKLAGSNLIVGVSTERLEQAWQALRDGATYVGVGPMFPTTTKEKPRLAGPAYAQEVIAQLPLPAVAIGGITPHNLASLTAVGVRTVAVCAAIIADPDPAARCRDFLERLA